MLLLFRLFRACYGMAKSSAGGVAGAARRTGPRRQPGRDWFASGVCLGLIHKHWRRARIIGRPPSVHPSLWRPAD